MIRRPPSHRAPWLPAIPRAGLVFLALLAFLVGQFEAKHHLVSVFHQVCAEHGGAIEDVVLPGTATHLEWATASGASPSAALHPHQTCDLPAALTQGAVPWQASLVVPSVPPVATNLSLPPSVESRQIGPPLLLLAPKNSPPLA